MASNPWTGPDGVGLRSYSRRSFSERGSALSMDREDGTLDMQTQLIRYAAGFTRGFCRWLHLKSGLSKVSAWLHRICGDPSPAIQRVALKDGYSIEIDATDFIGRSIFWCGNYDPKIWTVIQRSLTRGGAFLDLGANFGIYSLQAAARVGSDGVVAAVEPNPTLAESLRRSAQASNAPHLTVVEAAAGETSGRVQLHIDPGSTATASVRRESVFGGPLTRAVDVEMLDVVKIVGDYFTQAIDVLKVDIEGVDEAVLVRLLDNGIKPQTVVFECHAAEGQEVAKISLVRRLTDEGYDVYRIQKSVFRLRLAPVSSLRAQRSHFDFVGYLQRH